MKITTFMLCDSINNVNLPQGTVVPQLIMPTTVLRLNLFLVPSLLALLWA